MKISPTLDKILHPKKESINIYTNKSVYVRNERTISNGKPKQVHPKPVPADIFCFFVFLFL